MFSSLRRWTCVLGCRKPVICLSTYPRLGNSFWGSGHLCILKMNFTIWASDRSIEKNEKGCERNGNTSTIKTNWSHSSNLSNVIVFQCKVFFPRIFDYFYSIRERLNEGLLKTLNYSIEIGFLSSSKWTRYYLFTVCV